MKTLRRILMFILLAVFLFSGGTVLYVQHQYRVGDALYAGVADAYIVHVSPQMDTQGSEAAGNRQSLEQGQADPGEGSDPQAEQREFAGAGGDHEGDQEVHTDPRGFADPNEDPEAEKVAQTDPKGFVDPEGRLSPEMLVRKVELQERGGAYLADPAPIQVDMAALMEDHPDVIGWLYCEDTPINYPVLQAADNSYYLHRSMDGSYSVFGSLFAESLNSGDFQDPNTIIYGHHMKNGSMFACLSNWSKQQFYEEHPVMWLLTREQDYLVVLESGYTTSAYSDAYSLFTEADEQFSEYIQSVLEKSDFQADWMPDDTGHWLMLSTCAYVFDNARYVLHGMLIPAASAGGVPFE